MARNNRFKTGDFVYFSVSKGLEEVARKKWDLLDITSNTLYPVTVEVDTSFSRVFIKDDVSYRTLIGFNDAATSMDGRLSPYATWVRATPKTLDKVRKGLHPKLKLAKGAK